jgi:GAF domain-containing protein
MKKQKKYSELIKRIEYLIEGETDEISVMSTIACELYHSFRYFNWVGFYRVAAPNTLKVGPYQGPHGCLQIPFGKGVCGKCTVEKLTQIIDDVSKISYHITCAAETQSEIVVPIIDKNGNLRAVLDIDSNRLNNFDKIDKENLETICSLVIQVY